MAYKIPAVSSSTPSTLANTTSNLGISLSAGTFSVTSADGTALSASNKGMVYIASNATPGKVLAISVTANQTFVDDSGSSTIVGNLFGFGASETMTGNDVPFYLYAIVNDADNAIAFGIGRTPSMRSSPSSATMGKTGSANADSNVSMFLLGDPTIADYDLNPCVMIGSFRMRLTTSGGDWTVQALNDGDGIGRYQVGQPFNLSTGVFGAASGSFFASNGGTAPIWSSQVYSYVVSPFDALVKIYFQASGASTDGVGAVTALLCLPFGHADMNGVSGRMTGSNRNGTIGDIVIEEDATGNDIQFIQSGTYSTSDTLANFPTANPVRVNVMYPIDTNL